jgi:TRAP-type C4-dicarboxylate transport system permease small subunit
MDKIRRLFYVASAWGAGSCLIAMTLLIISQIVARLIGVVIPSSEDFAGWLLSAIIFFGLAYTFNNGGHIRVTIALSRFSSRYRHLVEYFNLAIGLLISGYLAYYTAFTVYESFVYEELTDTYLAVPIGFVQLPMAIGSICLFLAMLDSLSIMIAGRVPNYISAEDNIDIEG